MQSMITVAGTSRFNSRWHQAAAPSRWWHNPTLSFGTGYPQYIPASAVEIDDPRIRANPPRPPSLYDVCVAEQCWNHPNPKACISRCAKLKAATMPEGRPSRPGRRGSAQTRHCILVQWSGGCPSGYTLMGYDYDKYICCAAAAPGEPIPKPKLNPGLARATQRHRLSDCIRVQGNCPIGYRLMGYDNDGYAICCRGSVAGPVVRNPRLRNAAPSGQTRDCSWEKIPGHPGKSLCCDYEGASGDQICISRIGSRRPKATIVPMSGRIGNPPPPPTSYDECVANLCWDSPNPGKCISTYCAWLKSAELPKQKQAHLTNRRRAGRISASQRRRANTGACCSSCANGGHCEGGCGANCTCGKEGPLANGTMRTVRNPDACKSNKDCGPNGTCSGTPGHRRCSYAKPVGYRPSPLGPQCDANNPCTAGNLCVNGKCVASFGYGGAGRMRMRPVRAY